MPPVYAASRAVLPDNVGQRLANFLWRVWGSEKILQNLTGSQLAAHFSAISEDGPLRTTPTQSPRASRNLSVTTAAYKSQPPLTPSQSSHDHQAPTVAFTMTGSSTPRSTAPLPREEQREDRLPSILKKSTTYTSPKIAEGSQVSSSQGTIVEDDGDEITPSATPRRNSPNTRTKDRSVGSARDPPAARPSATRADSENFPPSSIESSSTLQSTSSEDTIMPRVETAAKTRRTKQMFHASTRKRPLAMKRKSSQSSSNATPSTASPRPLKPYLSASDQTSTATAGPTRPQSDPPDPLHSPDSKAGTSQESWEDTTEPPTQPSTTRSHPRSSRRSSLVEPDFRSKFVEKTRSAQSSFVNLPSLLRKPSATTATSASQAQAQPQLAGRGRGKVTFTEGSKPPGPAGPAETGEDGGEDGEGQVLPRTKSQLTLLLEKDRRAGGSGSGNGLGRKGS